MSWWVHCVIYIGDIELLHTFLVLFDSHALLSFLPLKHQKVLCDEMAMCFWNRENMIAGCNRRQCYKKTSPKESHNLTELSATSSRTFKELGCYIRRFTPAVITVYPLWGLNWLSHR